MCLVFRGVDSFRAERNVLFDNSLLFRLELPFTGWEAKVGVDVFEQVFRRALEIEKRFGFCRSAKRQAPSDSRGYLTFLSSSRGERYDDNNQVKKGIESLLVSFTIQYYDH
jgi:hypothetical protein